MMKRLYCFDKGHKERSLLPSYYAKTRTRHKRAREDEEEKVVNSALLRMKTKAGDFISEILNDVIEYATGGK